MDVVGLVVVGLVVLGFVVVGFVVVGLVVVGLVVVDLVVVGLVVVGLVVVGLVVVGLVVVGLVVVVVVFDVVLMVVMGVVLGELATEEEPVSFCGWGTIGSFGPWPRTAGTKRASRSSFIFVRSESVWDCGRESGILYRRISARVIGW